MLTLLSPAALWSLAALALPLALHLWRQPPRTVRLPSLRFIQAHVGRRLQDLRWRERLLLFTRLGLLAILGLLLARPQWHHLPPTRPQRWALLDPSAALDAPSLARLHALQAAGYETYQLAPGLPVTAQLPTVPDATAPDLWSLLREADASLPAGSTLAIFSPARLTSLNGLRPALRAKTEWIKTPDLAGASPHPFIAAVRTVPASQAPVVTLGVSDANSTHSNAKLPAGWKLTTRSNAACLLSPTGDPSPWTAAATCIPTSVLILHDPARVEDARYLAAAIRAALQTAHHPLDLHSTETTANLATLPVTDWTFWLSATEPPPPVANRPTHLFRDAPHPDSASPDWIIPQPDTSGTSAFASPVRLWRRGAPPAGSVFWTDAHGSPLLTFTANVSGPRWTFASRLHPDYTDLPRSTAFPSWLQFLLLGTPRLDDSQDFRLADLTQARPSDSAPPSPAAMLPLPGTSDRDLHALFWTLAAFLFLLERFLSHARRPVSLPRTPATRPAPVSVR